MAPGCAAISLNSDTEMGWGEEVAFAFPASLAIFTQIPFSSKCRFAVVTQLPLMDRQRLH